MQPVRVEELGLTTNIKQLTILSAPSDLKRHRAALGLNPQLSSPKVTQGNDGIGLGAGIMHITVWEGSGVRQNRKRREPQLRADGSNILTVCLHRPREVIARAAQSDDTSMHKRAT